MEIEAIAGVVYLRHVSGKLADSRYLEDSGVVRYRIIRGPLAGLMVDVYTDKYADGAYSVEGYLSNGVCWKNELNGSWQSHHQREEEGDIQIAILLAHIGLY